MIVEQANIYKWNTATKDAASLHKITFTGNKNIAS